MGKRFLCFAFVLLAIIVSLSSCAIFGATHEFVIDENHPLEDSAVVIFEGHTEKGWFHFYQWNGSNIGDELHSGSNWSNDDYKFTVPAGENSFVFDITFTKIENHPAGGTISRDTKFDNIELSYAFKPGGEYTVKGKKRAINLLIIEIVLGYDLELYDTTERSELLKKWELKS